MKSMTTSQIAYFYGVHPQTIRRWCKDGKLSCSRTFGNHRRFDLPTQEGRKIVAYAKVSTHDQPSISTIEPRYNHKRFRFRYEL